jgi:uncharacterized protein YpmB
MDRFRKSRSAIKFIIIFIVIIILIILITSFNGEEQENFSPYYKTGGCPLDNEWDYLKKYTDQDYYKNNPYIYPPGTNYVKALYGNYRRHQN